jgi:ubiquinone biosynthesis protein
LFADFDREPVAAASSAQVHRAVLASGELVAVKVRLPNIARTIESDLAVLTQLAGLAERVLLDTALVRPVDLVAEFARSIRREQDLAREGRVIERFARAFENDPTIRFPRIYWPLTRSGVLTMEFLDGVKVSDICRAATSRWIITSLRSAARRRC